MVAPVRLRKPLERVVREGHPWIYRDALEDFDAAIALDALVEQTDIDNALELN